MNTSHFKKNTITKIPNYKDGYFDVLYVEQVEDNFLPQDKLFYLEKGMPFQLLSISDRTKFEFEERDLKVTHKLRIPQTLEIDANKWIKLGDKFLKVFNAYHFVNGEGFKQTDLTLIEDQNIPDIKEVEDD